ncbi:MAG: hypothetical protein LC676_10935 [Loktanella sp.]|nr:hypothetical protein [Loktanella sp.]
MPFDQEPERDRGGGGGRCDACGDCGFIHVIKIGEDSHRIEAQVCPARCSSGVAFEAWTQRQVDQARAELGGLRHVAEIVQRIVNDRGAGPDRED